MKHLFTLLWVALTCFVLTACVYNDEETLYGVVDPSGCDTLETSFSGRILPILEANCTGCHSGAFPSNNMDLTTYENVRVPALDGRLRGAIAHEPDWSPMPKGGDQLPLCDILAVTAWVNQGVLDN